ncbi:hypothetical protein LSH36_1004g00020 [Paralvinella palmiformis]|uniref:Uncharacterized protein n=1 Tax=Paralvinella palmiformis TaxID=53620 RepID=A0AAD9IXB8_9ANNE|nr:hypothetical protein LSH36_1004g00020 [Paralvinella palmiformis]
MQLCHSNITDKLSKTSGLRHPPFSGGCSGGILSETLVFICIELERSRPTDVASPEGLALGASSMEVDAPGPSLSQALTDDPISAEDLVLNPLKRSNSAPMINVLVAASAASCSASVSGLTALSSSTPDDPKPLERVRRFSTSSMALNSTPIKVPSRLVQIKREETMAQTEIEAAHEREIQSTIQMSHSMEEIFVDESTHQTHSLSSISGPGPGPPVDGKRPKSLGEPLHIHVSQYYPYASSPSPTRVGKQCFSPSLQQPVYRTGALTPSPSPSPTRKSFASPLSRRSLSPITLRPSPLGNPGTKRKMDLDGEKMDTFCSPAKRFLAAYSPGGITSDRTHPMSHHILHSLSSSSSDVCNSPDQRVPNVSTASSPASFFRPVRDSTDSRGTDSETSDMTEAADMSEPVDMSSHLSESITAEASVLSSSTSASSLSPFRRHQITTVSSASSAASPSASGAMSSASSESSSGLSQTMSTMSVSPVPVSSSLSSSLSLSSTSSALYTSSVIQPVSTLSLSTMSPSTVSASTLSATSMNYFGQNKVTEV